MKSITTFALATGFILCAYSAGAQTVPGNLTINSNNITLTFGNPNPTFPGFNNSGGCGGGCINTSATPISALTITGNMPISPASAIQLPNSVQNPEAFNAAAKGAQAPAISKSAQASAADLAALSPAAGGENIYLDDPIAYANSQLMQMGMGGN